MNITRIVRTDLSTLKVEITARRGSAASLPLTFQQINETTGSPEAMTLTGLTFALVVYGSSGTVAYTFAGTVNGPAGLVEFGWTATQADTLPAGWYTFKMTCSDSSGVVAVVMDGAWRQGA